MQIKFYLSCFFIFISLPGLSQDLFPKKELYHVWILASEKLNQGHFDDALKLYHSHAENPAFSMKVRQISRLKEISLDGAKLMKKRNFAGAISKFKEYRKLKDISTIGIFERNIEHCLEQINKGNLNKLNDQQRVITGFELVHRGREKLSKLDTAGAKFDFARAKALAGSRNSALKEQYVEGMRISNELSIWGKKNLNGADRQPLEEIETLATYREIRNIDIPEIELRIRELRIILEGKISLPETAKLCDTDLLLTYVNSHGPEIEGSELLLARLREFKSTRQKISVLKENKANAETVESAYESLLSWTSELPSEIRADVKSCIQTEYNEFRATLPKESIVRPVNCEGQAAFEKSISLISKELLNCNIIRSRELWQTAVSALKDCDNASALLTKNASLRDSISSFAKNDSLLSLYRKEANEFVESGQCSKALEAYEKMRSLRICAQDVLNAEIKNGIVQAKNCKKDSWWKPQIVASIAGVTPKYSVGGISKNMATGWMASGGISISYIDHKNLAEFLLGIEYFQTNFYSADASNAAVEDFNISGVNLGLGIKLHLPNTNPSRLRPYLKFGPEVQVPIKYRYENYSLLTTNEELNELQKTVIFVSGALGIEIQKEKFGAFVELFGASGLGNIYNSDVSHLSPTKQKVEMKLNKFGIKIGFRVW
jgi:hypothetical protein